MNDLTETQRQQLTQLLDRRAAELQEGTHRLRDAFATPAGVTGLEVRDSAEDGQARMQSTLDLVQLRRQEEELGEVLQARERLREGSYGRCEECDEPIPFERLAARPQARLCVRHEEAWERAHPEAGRALA